MDAVVQAGGQSNPRFGQRGLQCGRFRQQCAREFRLCQRLPGPCAGDRRRDRLGPGGGRHDRHLRCHW
jgi:hypothetical protein